MMADGGWPFDGRRTGGMAEENRSPVAGHRSRFIIAAALAVAALGGCDYLLGTSLKDVQADPLKYEGKSVTLKGTVAEVTQLPLINVTTYTLQDGNAKIVIFTKAPLPKVKDTIKVKGTVKSTMIVNGKSVGQHMEEVERLK